MAYQVESVEEFLARGGRIKMIRPDVCAYDNKDIERARRHGGVARAIEDKDAALAEAAEHAAVEAYRAAQLDGWTEANAADYADAARAATYRDK